jgi:hypothetical protein
LNFRRAGWFLPKLLAIVGLAFVAFLGSSPVSAGEGRSHETLRGTLPGGGSVTVKVTFGETRRYAVAFRGLRMSCEDGSKQLMSFDGGMTIGKIAKDRRHFGLGVESSGYFGWNFKGRLKKRTVAVGTASAHTLKRHESSVHCSSGHVPWRARS